MSELRPTSFGRFRLLRPRNCLPQLPAPVHRALPGHGRSGPDRLWSAGPAATDHRVTACFGSKISAEGRGCSGRSEENFKIGRDFTDLFHYRSFCTSAGDSWGDLRAFGAEAVCARTAVGWGGVSQSRLDCGLCCNRIVRCGGAAGSSVRDLGGKISSLVPASHQFTQMQGTFTG